MRALAVDGQLKYVRDYPVPDLPGGALIRVIKAGICATDLEILKGYKGFSGILVHEFVGIVERCEDAGWVGKRVVGEINISCNDCKMCKMGMAKHCQNRRVLGILNHDGCMADYCVLPVSNLHEVPKTLSDDRAVLIEVFSAAGEILNRLQRTGNERVVVLGDGRIGILCAWVMTTVFLDVTLVGHHENKLDIAQWRHLKCVRDTTGLKGRADIVIEATGTAGGVSEAMALCRPRGIVVLKSTVMENAEINLTPMVVNEQILMGSRCGDFAEGIQRMTANPDMPLERLITAVYPIDKGVEAFEHARQPGALKILVDMG